MKERFMASTRSDKDHQGGATAELGPLPVWDLGDLYAAPDSPELNRDIETTEREAQAFAQRYQGKLAALSGAALGSAIAEYERLQETLGRIMSYASLLYSGDMANVEIARFFQNMQEKVNALSSVLLFFTLEINRLDDDVLMDEIRAPELARYRPWLRDTRAFRPHQLSDELEKMLHEKYVAGRAAWTRLFDETMAALRFPVEGKELTSAEALHLLSDANPETRRGAAKAL